MLRTQPLRLGRKRCFTKDESGPIGVGLQKRASNCPKLRGVRAFVVSVDGIGGAGLRQVWIEKTNASEPLMTSRNEGEIAPEGGLPNVACGLRM